MRGQFLQECFLGLEPKLVVCNVRLAGKIRYLGEVAMPGSVRVVSRLCVLYPAFRIITEEKRG